MHNFTMRYTGRSQLAIILPRRNRNFRKQKNVEGGNWQWGGSNSRGGKGGGGFCQLTDLREFIALIVI